MGGEIGVESRSNTGSTFWFCIPLPEAELPAQVAVPAFEAAPTISAESTAAPKHLLIVEDNLVNQRLAARFIEKLGYTSDLATNGSEAVDLVLSKQYSLVLMDCQMPVMDGFTATEEIRKREVDRHTPIIAVTARAMKEDEQHCFDVGMDAFIAKPLDLGKLAQAIGKWTDNPASPNQQTDDSQPDASLKHA